VLGGLSANRKYSGYFLFARDPRSTPDRAHLRDADYSLKWISAAKCPQAFVDPGAFVGTNPRGERTNR